MNSKLIHVEFVDTSTGKVFGAYDAPPDTLPEDFSIGTQLPIGDNEWSVVKAEPLTRAEYLKSGKLRLTLAKIMMMPVKDILYSLPTIYNSIPAVDSNTSRAGKQVFEMHEDNWRQIEFVASVNHQAIENEMRAIANIYDNHRVAQGFNKLHVRSTPKSPLTGNFSKSDLEKLFVGASAYDGVTYQDNPNLMMGVFALRYGKIVLYGAGSEQISVLGLQFLRDGHALPVEPIAELMKTYQLYLVDWCRTAAVTSNGVGQYLQKMEL